MLVKSQKIIFTFGAWAMLMIGILILFNSMNYEFLIALDVLGLLVIVQLMSPYVIKPKWRSRLDINMLIGIAVFGLIVLQKVLNLLGSTKV